MYIYFQSEIHNSLIFSTSVINYFFMKVTYAQFFQICRMTLVHSRRRIGAPKRTCIRENTTTSNERATDSDVVEEDAEDIYVRGCSQLPPTIPNEADRPLIRPEGKT